MVIIMKMMNKSKFSEYQIIFKFFQNLPTLSEPLVMVDVGAQVGLWTIPYARLGWTVVAFEASPVNYKTLQKNLEKIENVVLVNKAVSNNDSESIKFYYSEDYIGINSLKVNHAQLSEDNFALVEMIKLSTELPKHVQNVTFLKTDIEGADLFALQGFDFTKYHPELIVCEYGGRSKAFGYTYEKLAKFGREQGYVIYASNWESSASYKKGDKLPEHKLISFGKYSDNQDLNWGDMIFVKEERTQLFESLFNEFDF